jgi:hypothetical protein
LGRPAHRLFEMKANPCNFRSRPLTAEVRAASYLGDSRRGPLSLQAL